MKKVDRYEYNIKADEIKKLYNRKDFAGAAAIADEIDWIKIKDNTMLNRIADIYENTKQYEKAKEVLLIAYERSPLGRQLAYKLTILSLRTQNFEEADEFYQDFVEMSPTDNAQYLLKYRIARAKGEELSVLIQILETYLKEETDERWQYELAKLYHDNGQDDKCVRMCNEIELWFNEGKYVTKARKLRSLITGIMEEYNKRYMPENFVAEHEAIRAKLDQKVSDEQKAEKPVEQTTTEQSQVETPKSLDNISVEQFFPEKQTVDDSDEDILEDENVYSDDETEPESEQNEEKTSQSDVNVYDNQGSTFKSLRDKLKNSESIKAKWSKFSKSIELSDIENAKNVLKTAQYAAVQAQKAADLAEAFAEEVKIRVDYLRGITGDMRSKDSLLKLREQLDEEEQIIAQKELEAMDGLNKEKINQILATKSGEVQPEDTIETDETSEEKKPELGEELNHTTEFNPEEIKVNIIDDYDDPSKTANIQEALRKSMEKLRQELEEQKNEEQTTEPFRDVTAIVPIDEIVPQTQPPVEKESKNEETSTDESVNEELNIDTESGDIGISVVDKSEITVGESENEEVPTVVEPEDEEVPTVAESEDEEVPTVAESEDEEVPAVAESENEEVPAVAEPEDEEVPTVNESENEGVSAVAEPEEKLNVQINREAAAVISGIADMEEISPESIEKSYEEIPIPVISNEELAESVRAMMDDEPEEEPVVEPVIEPIVEPVVEPVIEPIVEPVVESVEKETEKPEEKAVVEPTVEPVIEPIVEPVVETVEKETEKPEEEPVVEPVVEPVIEPIVEPVVETVEKETEKPEEEPVVEPIVEPVIEPIVEPVVETVEKETEKPEEKAVVEPIVEPVIEPIVEPVVETVEKETEKPEEKAVVEPIVEPVIEPIVEPVVETVEKETVKPEEKAVVEPIVEPVVEPTVEPVIEPIVEPVVEPVKEETGEAKLESSSESSVSQPKTSEILDAFEEVQYPARRKSKSAGKNKSSDISKETEKNKIVQENSKPADNSAGKEETLSEKKQTSKKIPQEYNELFSNFANLDSMEDIVADTLDNLIHKFQPDGTSSTNNVVITGSAKSGKTTLGLDLIKAANRGRGRNGRRVAKIKATALNKRGVSTVMAQILGADLIIEQAGNLMPSTLIDLMTVMKNYTEEMLIILEDDKPAIDRMLITHSELKKFFNNRLDIIEMGITEMVKLAREYARSQFYDIDEMGELALSAKLDDISGSNPDISIEDIEEVIDDAIDHANKFSIGKIFGKMKKGKGEYQTLSEQDFL